MKRTFATMIAFGALVATAVPAKPVTSIPVKVGGTTELDACGSVGRVYRLKAKGAFLSVRAAPAKGARETGRLKAGHLVWMCDDRSGWVGIVYDANPARQQPGSVPPECGVASPVAQR